MRLISEEEAYKTLTEYYHHRTEEQHKALKEALGDVYGVAAISIEWIAEYLNKLQEERNQFEMFTHDWETVDDSIWSIYCMVSAWEKMTREQDD